MDDAEPVPAFGTCFWSVVALWTGERRTRAIDIIIDIIIFVAQSSNDLVDDHQYEFSTRLE